MAHCSASPWRRSRPAARDGGREARPALGVGPAYETLGKLPVMHQGRIKPLDTLAREEVKQIFGRETIKLHDADGTRSSRPGGPSPPSSTGRSAPSSGTTSRSSSSNTSRSKRLILADAIQARLTAIADRPETTPAADRDALKKLAAEPELSTPTP